MRPFGKYRLEERLGEGSFAEVWKARVATLQGVEREVALKLVHPEALAGAGSAMGSVINEALLGAQLKHPCIVEVLEFGYVRDQLYIAMELVEGVSVRQWQKARGGRALPLPVALEIGRAVALALQHAHERTRADGSSDPVVHLDLKPENILLGWDGRIKLTDFGIARWAGNVYDTDAPGMRQGSPHYMSPEQIAAPEFVGPASDLFSLGTTVLELVSGRHPFHHERLDRVLQAIREEEPTQALERVRERCPELVGVLRRMMAKDIEQRPRHTRQVAEVFAELTRRYPMEKPLPDYLRDQFPDLARPPSLDGGAYPTLPPEPSMQPANPPFTDTYTALQAWSGKRHSPWVVLAWIGVGLMLVANAYLAWLLFFRS